MWVSDKDDGKVYAYKMSDKSRDSGKDFDTLDAAGNDDPRGIWSDETTMWVADGDDGKVYAYKMSDKSRDSGKDFDTLDAAGNDDPKGMWSDGTTMWVTDDDDDKVYAYNLRSSVPAQAPTGLTATALGATIVDLTWTAPADNGGSDITGYKVEVSDDGTSGSWSDLAANTGNTNAWYRHTGLSDGETRHYRVSAINAQGTSDPSSTADATTMAGQHYAVPSTINGDVLLSAVMTVGSPTAVRLGYVGGPPVHGALSPSTFDHGGTRTVTGLFADSLVSLVVQFDSALGAGKYNLHLGPTLLESDRSATSSFAGLVLLEDPPWQHGDTIDIRLVKATAPNMPTGLSATSSGTSQIDLEWTAPMDDGGRAVTAYKVEVSDDGSSGSWDELVADTGNADTEYSHTGLSEGQTRHYRVSAINAAGTSEASDSDDATTQRAAPDPPTLSSAEVNTLSTIIALRFSENLDRSAGGTPPVSAFSVSVDGVSITVGDAEILVSSPQQVWLTSLGLTIYQGQNVIVTYTDPTSGDDAAAIQDSDGDDTPSFTTGQNGVPAVVNYSTLTPPLPAPTGFRAEAGDGEVTLSWDPPSSGSDVTHHDYRFKADGSYGDWIEIDDSGPGETNASGFTVTEDINNGTTYTFQLRGGGAGDGPAAVSEEVTPQGPPRIETVQVVSGPGLDDGQTYGAVEEIRIEVTFDQPVVVTGDPELEIKVGSASRHAQYDSGDGEKVVVFVYVVQAGDRDNDGIEIGDDALRLDGNDGIRNPTGDDAVRTHDGPGRLAGHMVNGSRRGDVHEHGASTHSHSVFNTGKRYYTETYLEHTHDGHEHSNTANGHPHPRDGHDHHVQPNLRGNFGPDLRSHGGVEHMHRCFSLKPSCNQGSDYNRRGDELGLPIEVTHSHEADSEPGHGFDWTAFFEEGGSGAAVSVADAEAVGGEDAHLSFAVTLEPALEFAVRVKYATADGTAAAGEDYRETSGVLEIPPGQTRATVRVPVRDRAPADGDETLTLTLGSATAATVADGEATGTIRAPEATRPPEIDDIHVVSTPRLRSQGASKEDTYGEGETIRIEVEFDQPVLVEGDPVMALEVCDPGESVCEVEARYESGSGTDTLVFAYPVFEWDSDRNGIAIPADPIGESIDDFDGYSIRNDAGQEADLSHGREGTQHSHKVNGLRSAAPHLSVADAEAHEADREMTFTVRLEPHGLGIVRVDYATRDGSAREGLDYTETRGTLTFGSLERERTVTVTVIDDLVPDDGETFKLRLSNPDGAELRSADREATGTIHNSDPPALSASFPASTFASASHSGADDRPQAVVAFSEAVAEFAADTPSVSVAGGAVDSVQPHTEDGLEHAWLFVLAPGGDGDVTFALVADAACAEGGICTPDGRTLTEAPEATTIPGPGEAEETSGAAGQAQGPGRHGDPRCHHPDLGRPPG